MYLREDSTMSRRMQFEDKSPPNQHLQRIEGESHARPPGAFLLE